MDRDRHTMAWIHAGNYHGAWGAAVMIIFVTVAMGAGFPLPIRNPLVLYLAATLLGFGMGKGVGLLVLNASGGTAQQIYMPHAKGTYVRQHSNIDALEAQGNYRGAVEAWEKLAIAEPLNPWPLIRAGELYMRLLRDPAMALERFRAARDVPRIAKEQHMYVSQKIIDLYSGPLGDHGRALVELRRFVEVHAGTREAVFAREAIARLKVTTPDADPFTPP